MTQCLQSSGFISQLEIENNTYLPGKDFLNLLTFLGCSPNINLAPEDGDKFCTIRLSEVEDNARCLGYTNTIQPKCPHCKKKIKNWQDNSDWQNASSLLNCDSCGKQSNMYSLKWRQEAGYGRYAIAINHIYPHEAVPSESLLSRLRDTTGFDWQYFYSQVNP